MEERVQDGVCDEDEAPERMAVMDASVVKDDEGEGVSGGVESATSSSARLANGGVHKDQGDRKSA